MCYFPPSAYLFCFDTTVCREVVMDLIEEYRAAERADYVTYGSSSSGGAAGSHAVASASNGATPQTTLPGAHGGPDSPMA
jgi:hypothetical protein